MDGFVEVAATGDRVVAVNGVGCLGMDARAVAALIDASLQQPKTTDDEAWFAGLLAKYEALLKRGESALDEGDLKALGKCLDENHALCQELTVSCPELDALVDAARSAGAIGAKMSGTGRGGLMIALTPSAAVQDKVKSALSKLAPQVWTTFLA